MPPSRFVGAFGEDWCVRPAQLGPPDNVNQTQMQWLIVPGPPMSCYLAVVFPRVDPAPMTFFHEHPSTWSIHVVLAGKGRHYVDDQVNDVMDGSVIYQGPGVRHCLHPLPNETLVHLSIQHPAAGYVEKEWKVSAEAGVAGLPGDTGAFAERFGGVDQLLRTLKLEHMWSSERWKNFVSDRKLDSTATEPGAKP